MAGNLMQVPVGYCGVKFNSFFDVTTLGVGAITGTGISVQPGIRPHSPAVYAGTDSMSRDMFGEAEITTNFPLSNSIASKSSQAKHMLISLSLPLLLREYNCQDIHISPASLR